MPLYEYKCKECGITTEIITSVTNRDSDAKVTGCPGCLKKGVLERIVSNIMIASDSTLSPNKATGGQWNALIDKITNTGAGIDNTAKKNLEQTKHNRGRRWKG